MVQKVAIFFAGVTTGLVVGLAAVGAAAQALSMLEELEDQERKPVRIPEGWTVYTADKVYTNDEVLEVIS